MMNVVLRTSVFLFLVVLFTTLAGATPHTQYPQFSTSEDCVVFADDFLVVSDDIIYHRAYYSINGADWQPITLTGDSFKKSDRWLKTRGTYSFPAFGLGEHYIITYSCTQQQRNWDCHDEKWQLLIVTNEATPTCNDGEQNGEETGLDCGGPDCNPCETSYTKTIYAVNAGGTTYAATDGTIYVADNYFSGGTPYDRESIAVADTTDDYLYATERYGEFSYLLPITNGNYEVTLQFMEGYFTTPEARVFNVVIEGNEVISDLDLYDAVGHDVAYDRTFIVQVSDGTLDIDFLPVLQNPEVGAILVKGAADTNTCNDGEQNGDETGVDCGGSCEACTTESTCNDKIQNGDETGVDCGGSCKVCITVDGLPYVGVNLAGGEFGKEVPGRYNWDYVYPQLFEVDYYMGKGMNTFRVPFSWERLQREKYADLYEEDLAMVDEIVEYITSQGAYVILDPHNYARYYGKIIGQGVEKEAFADFWSKLANHYKGNDRIIFELMNEPYGLDTNVWLDAANAAIDAIRNTGAKNLIIVTGNYYGGTSSWCADWVSETKNCEVMTGVVDPLDNFIFGPHNYLDSQASGREETCVSAHIGVQRVEEFTSWAREHNYQALLGEFGGGRNQVCYDAIDNMLAYMEENSDVWVGWTYWASWPVWGEDDYLSRGNSYFTALEPYYGEDRPQMAILEKYLNQE